MSHRATNWAVEQRGLKPATKIVLWHLADRHNPDHGCFPSQRQLAHDCEMSRSSINNHLAILEQRGLICRQQSRNDKTFQQENTRYLLAFEDGFPAASAAGQNGGKPPKPSPETGHGIDQNPVSKNEPIPCPKNSDSRVQNLDTNPVREPVREPVIEREHASRDANAPGGAEEASTVCRSTWQARLKRVHATWPTFATDSSPRAEKLWFALSEAERQAATDAVEAYLDVQAKAGRKTLCAFTTYLAEKRWEKVSQSALKVTATGAVRAKPFGKMWGAIRFADLLRPVYGHIPPLTKMQEQMAASGQWDRAQMIREKHAKYGWPKANTMHTDAIQRRRGVVGEPGLEPLSDLFGKVARGSDLAAAWKALHAERGWPWLGGDRDLPEWLWMPDPPEPTDTYPSLLEAVRAAMARFETHHQTLTNTEAAE